MHRQNICHRQLARIGAQKSDSESYLFPSGERYIIDEVYTGESSDYSIVLYVKNDLKPFMLYFGKGHVEGDMGSERKLVSSYSGQANFNFIYYNAIVGQVCNADTMEPLSIEVTGKDYMGRSKGTLKP